MAGKSREQDTPLNWTPLTDPCSSTIPPVFTRDGSYFFSLEGSSVKIYSTATGLVVSTLTAPPPTGRSSDNNVFTCAVVNPQNSFQLISATREGKLLIWDFVNGTLLQDINVGQDIHMICTHESLKGSVFVASSILKGKANEKNAIVLQVSLNHTDSGKPVEKIVIGKIRFPSGLAVSASGNWLIATAAHKVYVARTSNLSAGFTKYVSPEQLTCLASHPLDDYFATGDDKGVIRLWYCLNDDLPLNVRDVEKRTQTRALHWHAHTVSSIAFSRNGAYLLSGGEEAVLVIWQLHTGKKEFVPRVGASISTISVTKSLRNEEEEYLLGLVDATYAFISSTSLKISRSYSRLKFDPHKSWTTKSNSFPLAVHALSSTLVLPSSHPSSLQIYSLLSSGLLSELEISPSNRVSRREDKPVSPARVERIAISSCGSWMTTVDCRVGDSDFRSEVYLKFWSWDRKDGNWILNTRVDRPHGLHTIIDMAFSPNSRNSQTLLLVSTGQDRRIKVWQLHARQGTNTDNWTCLSTLTFRSESLTSISWSYDSSLFAVAAGPHIALYDPFTKSLRQTLTTPNSPAIRFLRFIEGKQGYLLSSASKTLTMWNLIQGCVAWQCSFPLAIDRIISHPCEPKFAIFHPMSTGEAKTKVSIFHVSTGIPLSVHTLPFTLRNVEFSSFQALTGFHFVAITHAWNVVLIGDSVSRSTEEGPKVISFNTERQKRTLFRDIFGISAFEDELAVGQPPSSTALLRKGEEPVLSDVPAFAIPSFDTFFDSFLSSFLPDRGPSGLDIVDEEPVGTEEDGMDQDEDTLLVRRDSFRLPSLGDLNAFTKLFGSTCRIAEAKAVASTVNGINGEHIQVNGSSIHATDKKSKQRLSSRQSDPKDLEVSGSLLIPKVNKKKRKKSSS